jgi:hypothetical protein
MNRGGGVFAHNNKEKKTMATALDLLGSPNSSMRSYATTCSTTPKHGIHDYTNIITHGIND